MATAFLIISIILVSAGFRVYFKRKYDVSAEKDEIREALRRNKQARVRHEAIPHQS